MSSASMPRRFVQNVFSFVLTARLRPIVEMLTRKRLFSISKSGAAYLYTDKHEWVLIDKGKATIGISKYAQEQLGEIIYVETPNVGTKLEADDVAGCLESAKAASEIFSPLSGTVTEVNTALSKKPGLVNSSPLRDGWLYKLAMSPATRTDKFMSEEAYSKYLGLLEGN